MGYGDKIVGTCFLSPDDGIGRAEKTVTPLQVVGKTVDLKTSGSSITDKEVIILIDRSLNGPGVVLALAKRPPVEVKNKTPGS